MKKQRLSFATEVFVLHFSPLKNVHFEIKMSLLEILKKENVGNLESGKFWNFPEN